MWPLRLHQLRATQNEIARQDAPPGPPTLQTPWLIFHRFFFFPQKGETGQSDEPATIRRMTICCVPECASLFSRSLVWRRD